MQRGVFYAICFNFIGYACGTDFVGYACGADFVGYTCGTDFVGYACGTAAGIVSHEMQFRASGSVECSFLRF